MRSLYGAIANTNKKEIMAISIDSVYQKVLALANKEQRGYITPQEFNLFADHAQMEIFEQYFYDLSQFKIRGNDGGGSAGGDFDIIDNIEERLNPFKKSAAASNGADISGFYKIRGVSCVNPYGDGRSFSAEEVYHGEQFHYPEHWQSPLLKQTTTRPTYYIADNKIFFASGQTTSSGYPSASSFSFVLNYISKPVKPNWTYIIGNNQNALFNPDVNAGWQDFELHASEENSLVIKILQLAGVAIKDFNLAQIAGQKEASVTQQEKQ